MDELHRVVMHPLMLAHAVNRHDVAVLQSARRTGLELEPPDLCRAEPGILGKDLERDVAPIDSCTAS